MTTPEELPTLGLLAIADGRLMGDIGDVYVVVSFFIGRSAFTHELPMYAKLAEPMIAAMFPQMAQGKDRSCEAVRDDVLAQYGEKVLVSAAWKGCLADGKSAITELGFMIQRQAIRTREVGERDQGNMLLAQGLDHPQHTFVDDHAEAAEAELDELQERLIWRGCIDRSSDTLEDEQIKAEALDANIAITTLRARVAELEGLRQGVQVKPLDLTVVMRHAFLSGVVAARNVPAADPIDGPALFADYVPYEPGSLTRIRAALVSPGDGWRELGEELQMIARTLPDNVSKETCDKINRAGEILAPPASEVGETPEPAQEVCTPRLSPDGSFYIHSDTCEVAKALGWPTESKLKGGADHG